MAPYPEEGLVPLEQARERVLAACRPLPPREVALGSALGLVLAEAVFSPGAVPAFENSAMDGYALRAADTQVVPAKLRVVGAVMAGGPLANLALKEGEAARIMTGAPLPAGADAVVMVEHTRSADGWVIVDEAVPAGRHVRAAGSDLQAGDEVLPAGTPLGAPQVAALAAVGARTVWVHPRPRVGVASTGDELYDGPGPLPAGKVRDSNRPGLLAQLSVDGFEAVDLGTLPDDKASLARVLTDAARCCDALLTSGGVSMGERDLVKVVLAELGPGNACSLKVAVRPAKPLAFSTLGERAVPAFGLPGNPVSAFVSYELFARPALRAMAGRSRLGRPQLRAVLEAPLPRQRDGKLHLARVALWRGPDGRPRARPSGGQGSHQLSALAHASALALVPDGEGLAAGDEVDVWVLDSDALAAG